MDGHPAKGPIGDPEIATRAAPGPDADRTDRDTMVRLASGDLGALDRLYEHYGAMAFSIAFQITGDRTTAEDVVQEAFLGAWRNAARYVDTRGTVRTWLLSIVHHRAIDAVRRRRPTTELPDVDTSLPIALTQPDAWVEVEQRLDQDTVRAALESISNVQREAIDSPISTACPRRRSPSAPVCRSEPSRAASGWAWRACARRCSRRTGAREAKVPDREFAGLRCSDLRDLGSVRPGRVDA